LKIFSYNVNGLRAAVKKGLIEWLVEESPDIICLQETKLQESQYPAERFLEAGYQSHLFCAQKKGYSGVAILSRHTPDKVVYGMGSPRYDDEGRFLRADFGEISVISVYHPSGTSGEVRQAFKMQWLDDFSDYVTDLCRQRPNLIICGDYNISHQNIDIHDPVRNANSSGFLPEERQWMSRFLDAGFVDTFRYLHPESQEYSWWSLRTSARASNKGWRLDYCIVTAPLSPAVQQAAILPHAHHSDHCPVSLTINPQRFPSPLHSLGNASLGRKIVPPPSLCIPSECTPLFLKNS
jgi:exodeoxyribonuclease-3